MEQTNPIPAPASSNNNWLYLIGGCCCLLIIGLIITAIIFLVYFSAAGSTPAATENSYSTDYEYLDNYDSKYSDISDQNSNYTTQNKAVGNIEGSISYPGEKIPSDLKVCAENIFYSDQIYCTDKLINDSKYTNSTGYNIEAPVGSYYVYSYLVSQPDKKAFYSDFVDCGLKAECTSHDKLIVDVYPDETTDQIDPIDWYNN